MEIGTIIAGVSLVAKLLSGDLFGKSSEKSAAPPQPVADRSSISASSQALAAKAATIMADYDLRQITPQQLSELSDKLQQANILGKDAAALLQAQAKSALSESGYSLAAYGYGASAKDSSIDVLGLWQQRAQQLQQNASPYGAQAQQMVQILTQLQQAKS